MSEVINQLSLIPVRKEPSDRSEMVSQLLYGETAEILDQNEKWIMVEAHHDHYQGWVDKKQMEICAGKPAPVLAVQGKSALVESAFPLPTWLPAGALIRTTAESEHFKSPLLNPETAARLFLGAPYLWGGRSVLGIDCSGLTQIAMRLAGHSIPRDAWQQAETGETIAFADEARSGDLAFFDNEEGRIIHTGIVIRVSPTTLQIIHASGMVRMDTLDHHGIFNADTGTYSHTLRTLRRIKF